MEKIDTRLSYSSAQLLMGCAARYWHYKVKDTKKDSDFEENYKAFNIGKAFHYVLEKSEHDPSINVAEFILKACKMFDVEEDKALIHAMVLKYHELAILEPLICVMPEIAVSNDIFIGYIDAVLADTDGYWYIVDLKTAASIMFSLKAKLAKDTQLNLYASFAKDIAEILKLDPKKFAGVKYRVITKPKLKRGKAEGYTDYVSRLINSAKGYSYTVDVKDLRAKEAYDKHKKLHAMSMRLRKGTLKPICNYSYCDTYYRACPYFSQCHGKIFSESGEHIKVLEV